MIIGQHPIVNALDQSKWRCHLVGSRFCGAYQDTSDYDFIVEVPHGEGYTQTIDTWHELRDWLREQGFKPDLDGSCYGPDQRLQGGCVWSWTASSGTAPSAKHPNVDVIPMFPEEARMRLAFFKALKSLGNDRGGKFQRAMKSEKAWPSLWQALWQTNRDLTPQLIVTGSDVSIEQIKKQLP